jgi:hypothetical protein
MAGAKRAFIALLPVAQKGVLSRLPQIGWDNEGESTGIPGCCERCGMLDSDCVAGSGYMRHRWGDRGSYPMGQGWSAPEKAEAATREAGRKGLFSARWRAANGNGHFACDNLARMVTKFGDMRVD